MISSVPMIFMIFLCVVKKYIGNNYFDVQQSPTIEQWNISRYFTEHGYFISYRWPSARYVYICICIYIYIYIYIYIKPISHLRWEAIAYQ